MSSICVYLLLMNLNTWTLSLSFFYRYLFSLQMKRDLMEGRLICTENTGALLASHLVQCMFQDIYMYMIMMIFCKYIVQINFWLKVIIRYLQHLL